MGDLNDACRLAEDYTKRHFSEFAVVAWDVPVEGTYQAWAEKQWLALSLSYRLKLRAQAVYKNGKRVEGIDLHSLGKIKGRR